MQRHKRIAAVGIAGACVLAGAAAGISQSAASSSSGSASVRARKAGAPAWAGRGFGHFGPGGGEIHAVEVRPDKAGTGFVTVTEDSGTITALDASAGTITVKEGTSSATYGTPTITIPSGASVMLDGATSSLAKLKEGDHVSISSSSEGTTVSATDSSFKPGEGRGPGATGGPPPGGMPQGAVPQGQSY